MSEWRDISTAPKDGTAIQAEIPGHGADNVISWFGGLLNDKGEDCGGWHWMGENEPPECWTDGVCWGWNEDHVPSVEPKRWKPLPSSYPTPTDERQQFGTQALGEDDDG